MLRTIRNAALTHVSVIALVGAIVGAGLTAAITSCRPIYPGAPANDYLGAAVFAASGIGATGVRRSVTKECWANCQPGTYCDHESGSCVPIPCGGCPVDMRCVRQGRNEQCVARTAERKLASEFDQEADGGPALSQEHVWDAGRFDGDASLLD